MTTNQMNDKDSKGDKMKTITTEQIDFANQVLMERLQEEAGKYVAQEMLKKQADDGDIMATLFDGLMKDSTLAPNCYALSAVIQTLRRLKGSIK